MNLISNIIKESSKIVSPAWPLKSFVAVNPFWNLREESFYKVLPRLTNLFGQNLFLPLSVFLEKYNDGTITESNILKSIELLKDFGYNFEQDCNLFIRESNEAAEHKVNFQIYSEFLSHEQNLDIKDQIVNEIAKYCSSYFDLGQAPFSLKNCTKRLYLEWRELIVLDRSFKFHGIKNQKINIIEIHEDPLLLIEQCAIHLGLLTEQDLKLYIMKICHQLMGWCSHIQFQLWQENLKLENKNRGTSIEDIVAIFMFYECYIKKQKEQFNNKWTKFFNQQKFLFSGKHVEQDHIFKLLSIWQRALELSYQEKILRNIESQGFLSQIKTSNINAQMVFCIDVRSEIIRRKIEENLPQISTHGFAGFFGVSLNCQHETHEENTYHCPVLLQPKINTNKKFNKSFQNKMTGIKSFERFLIGLKQGLASSFAYVEFFGILSGFKIFRKSKPNQSNLKKLFSNKFMKPSILETSLSEEEKLETAIFVLTHLGMKEFADVVIICGHGSLTTNNAFASSLECGACGGHAGDLNAKFICKILNDKNVREGIEQKSNFKISKNTQFIPALHETVGDEIYFLEKKHHSIETQNLLQKFELGFKNASLAAQKERMGISNLSMPLANERSTNWSEVRQEWALVKNASFIIAPRERTLNINLEGRTFLHDYDFKNDEGMKTLELIMTAPMVVTNWINMQYYASAVCPETYGSGNKVLHNIDGLFGVLEGNGGDLKIGLPFQSVHDGQHLIHEPLRLSVFIEAPQSAIEDIIQKHGVVHSLVENQWLHIFAIDRHEKKILFRRSLGKYETWSFI